jgi:squalene synthase HpnC
LAVDHYENFPVASILLPRRLVPAVEAIYAFARSADDLADEGDAAPAERLAALQAYEAALDAIEAGTPQDEPMFRRLAAALAEFGLPLQPLRDLLSAFKQDVVTTRYPDFPRLLDYCRRSADPVGRLMLGLYGVADAASLRESDAICTALQLINFWQDVAVDITKGRIYLPLDDLARFGVTQDAIEQGRMGPAGPHRLGIADGRAGRPAHPGSDRTRGLRRVPAPPAPETTGLARRRLARGQDVMRHVMPHRLR